MAQNGRRGGSRGQGQGDESDVNQRREIRRNYRELMARAQRERSELIQPGSDGLSNILGSAADLFDQVSRLPNRAPTAEAVLDAQLLKTTATLGYQKAKKLYVDNKFDHRTFMEKLITFMNCRRLGAAEEVEIDEAGWSTLASHAEPAFRRATSFHFMYGTFEREPPRRRNTAGKNKNAEEPTGPAVVPMKVKTMSKGHQEVTTEEVERMVGILHQVTMNEDGSIDPVSFFEFVINPHSFAQTVENIFHMSFVLKDGHAKIYLDNDNLPVIEPAKPHSEEQSGTRIQKKQVLVSIDIGQWEELIRVFDIKEPLIPTRTQNGEQNGHGSSQDQ